MAGSNFLDRFRPVGAPGPGAPVGVPAADISGAAAELAPVFAALAADAEACRGLIETAAREADETLVRARERAAALLAQARLDVGSEQASAAALVLTAAADRDAVLVAESTRRAVDLERAARSRLPDLVNVIIERLLAERPVAPS